MLNKSENILNMALIRTKWDSDLKKFIKHEISKGRNNEKQIKKNILSVGTNKTRQPIKLLST